MRRPQLGFEGIGEVGRSEYCVYGADTVRICAASLPEIDDG
jgi:hypothetical protein